jgi:hypothetical protein
MWENISYAQGTLFSINPASGNERNEGIRFDTSNLNANGELPIAHGRKTLIVTPFLYDPAGRQKDSSNYFQIVDADNCKIVNGNDLDDGIYLLILKFLYV